MTHFFRCSCLVGYSGIDGGEWITTDSLRSVLLMNPSMYVSLPPCSLFLDDLGVEMSAHVVLVSILGLLKSSRQFLLDWLVCRLCLAVLSSHHFMVGPFAVSSYRR